MIFKLRLIAHFLATCLFRLQKGAYLDALILSVSKLNYWDFGCFSGWFGLIKGDCPPRKGIISSPQAPKFSEMKKEKRTQVSCNE